jgi:5'-nucleotidase
MKQYKILISNDDGINAPGLKALVNEMKKLGAVTVVAPDRQRSATSSCLSIDRPLRVWQYSEDGVEYYSIDGTPTDCVKLALSTLMSEKPDLVVAGINHGKNTSINVLYSGTCAAAIEGYVLGIPSIAFSLASHNPYNECLTSAKYSYTISKALLESGITALLNVNYPTDEENIQGIKLTTLSRAYWQDRYEKRSDPFGRTYYWFAGSFELASEISENDDDYAINNNYVSITPIKLNFLDKDKIVNLQFLDKLKI